MRPAAVAAHSGPPDGIALGCRLDELVVLQHGEQRCVLLRNAIRSLGQQVRPQPVREGALILDGEGNEIGRVTSGTFSPTLQRPIAMGYVATPLAAPGTALKLEQRGKLFDATVAPMPFVPHRYHRKQGA